MCSNDSCDYSICVGHYFSSIIADVYISDRMDSEFLLAREANERNNEVLEHIHIDRHFKDDISY